MVTAWAAQISAPSFFGLLDTIWEFILAWMFKYWWALVIVGVVWYARHYRNVVRSTGSTTGASFTALNRTIAHFGEVVTETSFRAFAILFLAVGGVLWLLKGVGTLIIGTMGLEPTMVGGVAAIFASIGAALGFDIRPWMVFAVFGAVVAAVIFFNEASESVEDV